MSGSANEQRDASLVADCANCVGLCCVALAFERSDDFAFDKSAGGECRNLDLAYRCRIHPKLRTEGMRGCTVFDCHGAGQKVSQSNFGGASWRDSPALAESMFAVFRVVRQLQEMLWYLRAAARTGLGPQPEVESLYETVDSLSRLPGDGVLALDLDRVRGSVNAILSAVSESVRSNAVARRTDSLPSTLHPGADLVGSTLSGRDLRGADLRGALLIAADLSRTDLRGADLLAADLRDATLSGADLSSTLFVTQMQLNAARGNRQTLIPRDTVRPSHWN